MEEGEGGQKGLQKWEEIEGGRKNRGEDPGNAPHLGGRR